MTKEEAASEFRSYAVDGDRQSGVHNIRRDIAEKVALQLGITIDELLPMKREDIRAKILSGEIII